MNYLRKWDVPPQIELVMIRPYLVWVVSLIFLWCSNIKIGMMVPNGLQINGHFRNLNWMCLTYIYGLNFRGYTPNIWPYMVQYLHVRILEFPLNKCFSIFCTWKYVLADSVSSLLEYISKKMNCRAVEICKSPIVIGFREKFTRNPIFHEKDYGFL